MSFQIVIKPYFWTIERFPVHCSQVVCRYVRKEVNINILASDVNGTILKQPFLFLLKGWQRAFPSLSYAAIWVKLFKLGEVENPVLKLSEMCQLAEWESWQFLFSSENPLPFFPSIHSFHRMDKWDWIQNLYQSKRVTKTSKKMQYFVKIKKLKSTFFN